MAEVRSLSALLRVLDEADAIRARQEATTALDRDELVRAAQQLDAAHTPEVLGQAVDAYLAASKAVAPPNSSSIMVDDTGAPFGWRRPQSEQERAALQRRADAQAWSKARSVAITTGVAVLIPSTIVTWTLFVVGGVWGAAQLAALVGCGPYLEALVMTLGMGFNGWIGGLAIRKGARLLEGWFAPPAAPRSFAQLVSVDGRGSETPRSGLPEIPQHACVSTGGARQPSAALDGGRSRAPRGDIFGG